MKMKSTEHVAQRTYRSEFKAQSTEDKGHIGQRTENRAHRTNLRLLVALKVTLISTDTRQLQNNVVIL